MRFFDVKGIKCQNISRENTKHTRNFSTAIEIFAFVKQAITITSRKLTRRLILYNTS